jgi:hypothetical protein
MKVTLNNTITGNAALNALTAETTDLARVMLTAGLPEDTIADALREGMAEAMGGTQNALLTASILVQIIMGDAKKGFAFCPVRAEALKSFVASQAAAIA